MSIFLPGFLSYPYSHNSFNNRTLPPFVVATVSYSMDSKVINRLKCINLIEEEGEVIKVRQRQREQILEEYSLNLLGKFHTTQPFNQWATNNFLRLAWKFGLELKIIEVGNGLYQFKFAMESQLQWVVNNGPWSFDNHLLLLRRWERGMTANSMTFDNQYGCKYRDYLSTYSVKRWELILVKAWVVW